MYVHVRLFGKITSLMDTLYIYFFMWKFISAQRVSLYSKYCNTSQATSMEKPEKDENWSWITVNFGSSGRAELEDTWKLNVYELPHMLPVMKLYEENCRSKSAAKSQYSVLFYA